MAKNLNFDEAEKTYDSQQSASKEAKKPTKKATTKDQADYLKLDLRPKGGKDYKTYVMTMASKKSIAEGRNITATNYIQELIDLDMQKNSGKVSKREKLIDQLTKLTDKQIDGLYALLADM